MKEKSTALRISIAFPVPGFCRRILFMEIVSVKHSERHAIPVNTKNMNLKIIGIVKN